jgi:hypothetical protein
LKVEPDRFFQAAGAAHTSPSLTRNFLDKPWKKASTTQNFDTADRKFAVSKFLGEAALPGKPHVA